MSEIIITEEVWANSQLSIARYYGIVMIGGKDYTIVDKRGHTIFECSVEAEKEGRAKAILPGEPADLCRDDFIPLYKKLGREKMFQFLKENKDLCLIEKSAAQIARKRLKEWKG